MANQVSDMQFQMQENDRQVSIVITKNNRMNQSDKNIENLESALPIVVADFMKDGKIISYNALDEIINQVFEGHIVIIKGAFSSEMLLNFRQHLVSWWKNNPSFPHGKSPSSAPEINYHRIDDGLIKSVCPHIFHQFGFNNFEHLESFIGNSAQLIAESMKDLQNKIAGTRFDISLTDLRLKVLQYPSGGGFLAEHSHPLEPQRIGLILSLSQTGKDFTSGGTFFQTPFGRTDTFAHHDIGDIILFRYDLPHAVAVVDEGKEIDWNSDAGKWSVVLELRETHALSHKV